MAESDHRNEPRSGSDRDALAILVAVAIAILVGMVWYVTYDFPSGKEVSLTIFLMFWHRELLILFFVLLILVAVVIQKFRNMIKSRKTVHRP